MGEAAAPEITDNAGCVSDGALRAGVGEVSARMRIECACVCRCSAREKGTGEEKGREGMSAAVCMHRGELNSPLCRLSKSW
jgi:hypothetical protein